jgi:hypothetical protein
MKKAFCVLLAFTCTAIATPSYPKSIIHVLEQLRSNASNDLLPLIDGCAVGYAGTPGTFYLLYPYIEHRVAKEDLLKMLFDESPAVRIMAAKVLLHSKLHAADTALADSLLNNPTKVMLAAGGCVYEPTTVGEVVKRLKKDKNFLGDQPSGNN